MPIDNAIELFNCSLCKYCETSLDGLAKHIRKHIKPEPGTVVSKDNNEKDATATTNEKTNLINGLDSFTATSTGAGNQMLHESSHDTTPLSAHVEIMNPRTVTVNGTHSVILNDSLRSQPSASSYKGNYMQSPQDKVPQGPYRNLNSQAIRHPNMHQDGRLDNIAPQPPPPRYVQLHPREPQYIEINSPHHPFTNQYVTNISGKPTLVHTDLVPVHSTKNGLQEIGPRGEIIYRNMPGTDRMGNIPKSIAPAPPLNSPNRISNNDIRIRSNHPYDANQSNVHHSYQPRLGMPMDNSYRSNHPSSAHPISPHTLKSQRGSHPVTASPLNSPYNAPSNHKPPDDRNMMKQYHMNRFSGMQFADIQKHSNSQSAMNIPNNGALFLNPEQLMLGNVNANILEQLPGLLVVPLKKTREVSCQTDSVHIIGASSSDKNSRGIQTELLMGQVRESASQNSPPVFGTFRTTDDLYECLVCGEEFASDHHLQEHVSKLHTYVCEKCYHSSTNINEHNMHITDCGNRDSQMVCVECNSTFVSLKKFNQHRSKVHNVRMPFRCGVCNVPFETHEAVMKHISTHDNEVPEFKCRYCIKIFQSADGLSKHFARHKTVDVLHECRFCKKSYSTNKLLSDHVSYVHVIRDPTDSDETVFAMGSPSRADKDKPLENEIASSASKKYPLCRYCDLAFKNAELMQQHTENCSKNNDAEATPFVCDVCKEYYSSDLQRKQHLKKEHKRDSGFRCPKCSKIYRTWSRLKFHTKQQHLKKTCPDCPMIFTKEHVLRKHQEDKHGKPQGQPGDRVYTCSLCHTMLHTLTELMNHRKEVHPELSEMRTADRSSNATMLSYIDNVNDNGTTENNSEEASHLKTYPVRGITIKRSPSSDELMNGSSFKCETCGLLFEDEKRLKNHKGLIHGEKPFKCNLCYKSFQYSSQVVWHMRQHKQKDAKGAKVSSKLWKSKKQKFTSIPKPATKSTGSYMCQFCGARFSQEKLLKNHKGSVHKIKLFSCDICNYQCGHSTELIWHVRTCRAKFKRKYPDSEYPTKDSKAPKLDGSEDGSEGDGYVCHVCDNAFTIFENYQAHMKTHPGEEIPSRSDLEEKDGDFKDTDFKDDSNFGSDKGNLDMYDDSETRMKSPSQLNANFGAEELLNIEPEFDQSTGEYVCPVCQKTTRSMTGMKTHYGRVHGVWSQGTSHIDKTKPKVVEDLIWPCKSCDRQFSTLGSLRHHSTVIHGFSINKEDVDVIRGVDLEQTSHPQPTVSYSCPYCDATFSKSKSIRVHAFKKHGTVLTDAVVSQWKTEGPVNVQCTNTNTNTDPNLTRYKCYQCKSKFRSTKALRVHSIKRHNLVLTKKELLRSKIRIKQSEAVPQPSSHSMTKESSNQVYPCDYCGRVFMNHRAYFTHYRQAHRDSTDQISSPRRPSKNEITNYNPSNESHYDTISSPPPKRLNRKVFEPGSGVDCPKCDHSFASVKGLYTHLYAAHSVTKEQYPALFPNGMPTAQNKQVSCSMCDKVCSDNKAMEAHVYKVHGLMYKDVAEKSEMEDEDGLSPEDGVFNGEIPDDALHENDNELRVVEAELGPPVCFICGRLFKSRRALMTHEYKYHGIRWVGNKRIFPSQVRNVPNLKSIANRSQLNPKINMDDFQNSISYSGSNSSLDGTPIESVQESDYPDESQSPEPVQARNEPCPKCIMQFLNRRALTTHLVRIHKWKKAKLHLYFGVAGKSIEDNGDKEVEDELEENDTNELDDHDILEQENREENDNGGMETDNVDSVSNGVTMDNGDNISNGDDVDNGDDIETTMDEPQLHNEESNDDDEMYVIPDESMFSLNGNNILDGVSGSSDVNNADVDINDNEGNCDTIKQSDIEAYEGIGIPDVNGDIDNSENIGVDTVDDIALDATTMPTGKYDASANNGVPFEEISTNS